MSQFKKRLVIATVLLVAMSLMCSCTSMTAHSAKKSADQLYEAIEEGSYEKAVSLYQENILGNAEYEIDVEDYLENFLDSAVKSYAAGETEESTCETRLLTVQKFSDQTGVAHTPYERANKEFRELKDSKEAFNEGNSFFSAGNYEEAKLEYQKVIESDINYTEAQEMIEAVATKIVEKYVGNIKELQGKGEYLEALDQCKKYLLEYPDDADLSALVLEIEKSYTAQVLEEGRNLIAQKQYSEAYQVFNAATAYVTDISQLEAEKENALAYIPVSLTELTPYYDNKTGYWQTEEQAIDKFGNSYDTCLHFFYGYGGHGGDESQITIYDLEKKYTHFTASLVASEKRNVGYDSGWGNIMLRIYCDDIAVYRSEHLTTMMRPIPIDLDLTGVSELKIEFIGGAITWSVDTLLGEPMLYVKYAG